MLVCLPHSIFFLRITFLPEKASVFFAAWPWKLLDFMLERKHAETLSIITNNRLCGDYTFCFVFGSIYS